MTKCELCDLICAKVMLCKYYVEIVVMRWICMLAWKIEV